MEQAIGSGSQAIVDETIMDLHRTLLGATQPKIAGSTAEKVIEALPAQPVIDVKRAAGLAGTSEEAARLALNSLAERGVLKQVTKRNWGRVWEAKGLWNLLDRFEERLAIPTHRGRPSRPAPRTR